MILATRIKLKRVFKVRNPIIMSNIPIKIRCSFIQARDDTIYIKLQFK